ncbi:MAG: IclR family transcriptional regulator [Thermodesulfobacteriota bacterium]|jgi:DNA-binding IclR family transcriptional regulator
MKNSVSSLDKGLDILCSFDFDNKALPAQSISQQLNMPLSTTYRYLMTFEKRGFLVREPGTKNFKLGFVFFRLGNIVSSQMELIDIVLPYMKFLSSESGETVLLTVINGWEAMCLEKVETNKVIKLSLERGSSLPLHAGASSKILLAYQKDSFIKSMLKNTTLTRFTKNTITDPILLKKELRKIQKQGFAFSDQEADLGVRAIGAPIFNHKGELVAGLSIAGPRERITNKDMPKLFRLVKEAAQKASHDFGYRVV